MRRASSQGAPRNQGTPRCGTYDLTPPPARMARRRCYQHGETAGRGRDDHSVPRRRTLQPGCLRQRRCSRVAPTTTQQQHATEPARQFRPDGFGPRRGALGRLRSTAVASNSTTSLSASDRSAGTLSLGSFTGPPWLRQLCSLNQPNPRTRHMPQRRCLDAAQQAFVGLPGADQEPPRAIKRLAASTMWPPAPCPDLAGSNGSSTWANC